MNQKLMIVDDWIKSPQRKKLQVLNLLLLIFNLEMNKEKEKNV